MHGHLQKVDQPVLRKNINKSHVSGLLPTTYEKEKIKTKQVKQTKKKRVKWEMAQPENKESEPEKLRNGDVTSGKEGI